MNLYEDNIKVLKEKQPSLYNKLNRERERPQQQLMIDEVKALNGEPILIVKRDEKVYRLNSLYNPSHEATVWSEQFVEKYFEQVYILYGLGNGYSFRALRNQIKGKYCIVVYEPSIEMFQYAMEHYNYTDILGCDNVEFVVKGVNEEDLHNILLSVVHWNNIFAQYLCVTNGYRELFQDEMEFVLKIIDENSLTVVTNHNTNKRFGKSFTQNIIANYQYLSTSNSIMEFRGEIPEGVPAIVVAAGPSLDLNVEQLKKAKGKAVIISVDRALDTLIAHGILPDFSITVDANKPPRFYDNPVTWEIPLFFPLIANNKIICRHRGRKIMFGSNPMADQYYERLGQAYYGGGYGGSVATAALTVAYTMGINTIILVGQDLAYKNGFTHAGGVQIPEGVKEEDLVKVKGINGEELYTGSDMYGYILWFQKAIMNQKDKMHVIDATEGGALIKGTDIMALENAIQEYCKVEFNVNSLLEKHKITDEERKHQICLEVFQDAYANLKEFYIKANKAENLCKNLLTHIIKYHGINNKGLQLVKELSKLNLEMEEMYIYPMIEDYGYMDSAEETININKLDDKELANQRRTFEMLSKLHKINKIACKELIDYLEPFLENYEKSLIKN